MFSADGTYGYVRSENLVTDETGLKADIYLQRMEKSQFLQVGNIVTFGRYEQDNNAANGPEEIEWIVLDVQEGKSLLLSRYGLDAQPYNREYVNTTWQTSTLRKWLNEEFINTAFTMQEQTGILITDVDNSNAQRYKGWSTSGGDNTQDKIFLLSYTEANKYLGVTFANVNNTESRAVATVYAIQRGAYTNKTTDEKGVGWWWLRSPGFLRSNAALVYIGGSLNSRSVNSGGGCVRPSLWIDLESGLFNPK